MQSTEASVHASRGDQTPIVVLDISGNFSRDVVRCLATAHPGRIHVLAPDTSLTQYSRLATFHVFTGRPDSDASIFAALDAVRKSTGAQVLLAVDEPAVVFVSRNQARLAADWQPGLVPTVETFDTVVNRVNLTCHLAKHNLPQPRTGYGYSPDEVLTVAADVGYPLLLKPVRSPGGGVGIRRADSETELRAVLADGVPGVGVVVQSYIQGHDLDAALLCRNGEVLAHTIYQPAVPSSQLYVAARAIQFFHDAEILNMLKRFMASLNYSGIANIDLRRSAIDHQVRILEVNARFWATVIPSHAAGVNFPALAVKLARGMEVGSADYREIAFVPWRELLQSWRQGRPIGLTNAGRVRMGFSYLLSDPGFLLHAFRRRFSPAARRGLVKPPQL